MKKDRLSVAQAPAPLSEARAIALSRLAAQLDRSGPLLARCLAASAHGDRAGPVGAAARLLNASTELGQVFAHVALLQPIRRTIVEQVQTIDPKIAGLNSTFRDSDPGGGGG